MATTSYGSSDLGSADYCRSQADSSPDASDSIPTGSRSKATIRVSLACVQCRSKHLKCDATQPACGRCLLDGKPCYYARSKRGIRDAKKRSLIPDKPPIPPSRNVSVADGCAHMVSPFGVPNSLSRGWILPKPAGSDPNEPLLSVFFNHFYPGHPILPPERYFLKHADLDPNPYQFLLSVINFCGALHTGHNRLNDLREEAYSAACGPLPFTVQSVQGLYLLAVIAFGEAKFTHHAGFAERSREMAVELGMHRKAFADGTLDPILAESYRRTWWYIEFQSITQNTDETQPPADLCDAESDVDVPFSEEWEYQSGNISMPMSSSQYEREATLGRSDFPSTALQAELCRIQSDISLFSSEGGSGNDEARVDIINRIDSRLCAFLRRVPRWKMDVVDPEGRPDQVLLGAVAWAHINRIRLRQSTSRRGLKIREYFHLGPARGPDRKGQAVKRFGWNPHSIDIQAASSFCDLFRYPFPIKSLQPMMIPGILRVAMVFLDACVFLGQDSSIFRERINTLIQILSIHGETWPLSKTIAEDIRAVADLYLAPSSPPSSAQFDQPSRHGWNEMAIAASFWQPMSGADFDGISLLDNHIESVLRECGKSISPVAYSFSTNDLAPPATLGLRE
ncbi:hypothetical protein GGS21DRAFT_359218 [Xylaria nigripes]|nr:hypothetical protein GGS21DRAFT_359218 [Xylaria nigripes]